MIEIVKEEQERANKLARQIIGAEPLERLQVKCNAKGIDFDLQSTEKACQMIKDEFCYIKSRKEGFYREPTLQSVRASIQRWSKAGLLEVTFVKHRRKIPGPNMSGTSCVNPDEVRVLFLSHPKYDLKVNQPNWQGARKCTSKYPIKRTWIQKFFRYLKKSLNIK